MTFAQVFDVPGPPGLYDALHAELGRHPADGLIVHVGRPVGDGTQVVEVWTSAEAFREWAGVHVGPAIEALVAAGWDPPEIAPVPFDARGLIVPSVGVAH